MEQGSFWEANSRWLSQENALLSWSTNFYFRVHGPYPEPDETSLHTYNCIFKYILILSLPPYLGRVSTLLSQSFSTEIVCGTFFPPIRATFLACFVFRVSSS
jgi:hypothetical protein